MWVSQDERKTSLVMPLEFSCDYITLVIFTFHKENFHKKEIPQLDRVFQAFWKYLNININITYFCVLLWNLFWNLETSLHTMWNNIFYSLNKILWLEKTWVRLFIYRLWYDIYHYNTYKILNLLSWTPGHYI